MATRPKESALGKEKKGVSPIGSSKSTNERRTLRPSTTPGIIVAKDRPKAPATSSTTGKSIPNYLKPTISSNPDAAKHTNVKKNAQVDTNKPKPTMMRRSSFGGPVSTSQIPRSVQSSSTRGERTTPPFSPKHSNAVTRPSSSSSDRVSNVVKAAKSQPAMLKTMSMPRTSSSSGTKKEVKTSKLKKATPSTEDESVQAPSTIGSEAEDQDSLDFHVEDELAKLESAEDLPPEKQISEYKEHVEEENHSSKQHVDDNMETLDSIDTFASEDHRVEHEHTPEPDTETTENVEDIQVVHEHTPEPVAESITENVEHEQTQEPEAETTENVEVAHEDIQEVHESKHTESDQHSIQVVNETPDEDGDTKEEQKETEPSGSENIQAVKEAPAEDGDTKEEPKEMEPTALHSIQPVNEAPAEDGETNEEPKETEPTDLHSIQAVNEAPAEDGNTKEEQKETEPTEDTKPVCLTETENPEENNEVAVNVEQEKHDSKAENKGHDSKESEKKPAHSENVVHKRQVGGPRNKMESPAYNDVIEETASKLVGKRVNKVRALAGAFETVISLQHTDSR